MDKSASRCLNGLKSGVRCVQCPKRACRRSTYYNGDLFAEKSLGETSPNETPLPVRQVCNGDRQIELPLGVHLLIPGLLLSYIIFQNGGSILCQCVTSPTLP